MPSPYCLKITSALLWWLLSVGTWRLGQEDEESEASRGNFERLVSHYEF